jgi:hypothetical protein
MKRNVPIRVGLPQRRTGNNVLAAEAVAGFLPRRSLNPTTLDERFLRPRHLAAAQNPVCAYEASA